MKKILALALAALMMFTLITACGGGQETPAAPQPAAPAPAPEPAPEAPVIDDMEEIEEAKALRVAFINAGPDDYYKQFGDVFAALGQSYGWEVTEINSEYRPDKELSNVQDMINAGMDAIAVITVQMEAAGEATILANEAGVPIFFVAGRPDESKGAKPDGHVSDNFLYM